SRAPLHFRVPVETFSAWARDVTLRLEVVEQLEEVALQGVRAALAVPVEVVAEVPVEQVSVHHVEVAVDPAFGEPRVEVLGRADVCVDAGFLVRAVISVGDGPQVIRELGDRRLPVAEILSGLEPGAARVLIWGRSMRPERRAGCAAGGRWPGAGRSWSC